MSNELPPEYTSFTSVDNNPNNIKHSQENSSEDDKEKSNGYENTLPISEKSTSTSLPVYNELTDFKNSTETSTATEQLLLTTNTANATAPSQPSPPSMNSAPPLPKRTYNFNNAICFKTSERILDDLRNEPFFFYSAYSTDDADERPGILKEETVYYADRLIGFLKNTTRKYQFLVLDSCPDYCQSKRVQKLPSGKSAYVFDGILVPNDTQPHTIPTTPILHARIKLKGSFPLTTSVNHKFYCFEDHDLLEEDRNDLIDLTEKYIDTEDNNIKNMIKSSLPEIIDSATFVSSSSPIVMRIEITKPTFDYQSLMDFEEESIELRYTSFLSRFETSQQQDEFTAKTGIPSVRDCLYTLVKVLKGPIEYVNNEEKKTLKPNTSAELNININLSLLENKLLFEKQSEEELLPPSFSKFGKFKEIGIDYYRRALIEVFYLGNRLFAKTPRDFFKTRVSFTDAGSDLFYLLNEPTTQQQLQFWNNSTEFSHSPSYTILSATPYYSEQLLVNTYQALTSLNKDLIPEYFDALKWCSLNHQNSYVLQTYVASLSSAGTIGFTELKECYKQFDIDINDPDIAAQLTDDMLIIAYQNALILSTDKQSKIKLRNSLKTLGIYRESEAINDYLEREPLFDIADAYEALETDPSVDDDILVTAYQLKVEDSYQKDSIYERALLTVALQRKSLYLINFIDHSIPRLSSRYAVNNDKEAYKYLGCDQYADDFQVIRIFQERMNKDTNANFKELWNSLKIIGETRKSKLIEGFLSSGFIDSRLLSVESMPAGINNIGNTCYLNSLLQFYFVIKPLRDMILDYNSTLPEASDFNTSEAYSKRRIGGRVVSYKETERSYQFMYQLRDLFDKMIHTPDRCVTPTRELAYLAFSPSTDEVEFESEELQPKTSDSHLDDDLSTEWMVVSTNSIQEDNATQKDDLPDLISINSESERSTFKDEVMENEDSAEIRESNDGEEMVTGSSQIKFKENDVAETIDLCTPEPASKHKSKDTTEPNGKANETHQKRMPLTAKISPDQIENALEMGRQQDVTECIENVLFQMESALEPKEFENDNEQIDSIKEYFYGKTKQTLAPVDPQSKMELPDSSKIRTKIERFLSLLVNVGDHPKDIYDALDTYFTEDLMSLDDGEVKRSLTITELPKILQIQVQRVQFDRERGIPFKSIEPLPFKEKLYMDRYMDTDDQTIISKRHEVFHWRHKIRELNNRKSLINRRDENGFTVREALMGTRDLLKSELLLESGVLVDSNTIEVLQNQVERIDEELKSINSEVQSLETKIYTQFDQFTKIGYSIFAIFIHRGQASYGHYWIYIKDPVRNVYRKYNDEIVSEVTLEEVLNFQEGNTATPYYLVFVKEDLDEFINPLNRKIDHEAIVELD
ncbi:peptidase activity protein [[Candida] boidinii]|nr:peptidase activity protein [[Candida] boidinii]